MASFALKTQAGYRQVFIFSPCVRCLCLYQYLYLHLYLCLHVCWCLYRRSLQGVQALMHVALEPPPATLQEMQRLRSKGVPPYSRQTTPSDVHNSILVIDQQVQP